MINHLSRLDIESTRAALMFDVIDELVRRGLRFGNREAGVIGCTVQVLTKEELEGGRFDKGMIRILTELTSVVNPMRLAE